MSRLLLPAVPLEALYDLLFEMEWGAGDGDSAQHDTLADEILRREGVASFDDLEV